ncbi:MAG TPA: bifunctional 5,10-methylenetetrahydrofolate dehydrogenase/5,10-methenyltetrahydrofolate cyclohydrolase [Gemmatimonadaceae bacterium]|nr:bifunctional 5,10-methylenetetrahydrofolate dehydrogenase/5,10-methenyltetrahydrofolate cyclohydrolase [Gemmatimonadaceae bacterium]
MHADGSLAAAGAAAHADAAARESGGQRGQLIDGALLAARMREEVAAEVAALRARGVTPGLTVVLVGDDPASAVYVRSKEATSRELGMSGETIRLPATATQDELLGIIDRLNADSAVHGILVQMPLPRQIDPDAVIRHILPQKDVDGFHPVNVGKLLSGARDGFVPCTPAGIQYMLEQYDVPTRSAECVIIGRSNIVGKPMAALMLQQGANADATVTVCHSRTRDLAAHTRRADILIVAAGRARMIGAEMVKPGAVVIDVGMNRIPDASTRSGTRLVGDVDFDAVRPVAALITPVPGGVGKMTIAMLMRNTVRAAARTLD